MNDRMEQQLAFLIEIDKLKEVLRQSLLFDKSRRENDAEHSWHLAVMAIILKEYADPRVDLLRVLKMLLIHDLVEVYAGDTPAYDEIGNLDKVEREQNAADRLFAQLPGDQGSELRRLWEEFDVMESVDAQYAASLDRLQPFISNVLTEGHTWKKLGATEEKVYQRMAPVRDGIPMWWDYVREQIDENQKKGYIQS